MKTVTEPKTTILHVCAYKNVENAIVHMAANASRLHTVVRNDRDLQQPAQQDEQKVELPLADLRIDEQSAAPK